MDDLRCPCCGGIKGYSLSRVPRNSEGIPLTLDLLVKDAKKYKSRAELSQGNPRVYGLMLMFFKDSLDSLFPKREKLRPIEDESEIRLEARKYQTRTEFEQGSRRHYNAARSLGIMDDLGFGPPRGGFNNLIPGCIYLVTMKLNDGTNGVMFGITNQSITKRFAPYQVALFSDRLMFKFKVGADARKTEKIMKERLSAHAITPEQSPVQGKFGNSGEIVYGIDYNYVLKVLRDCCTVEYLEEVW